MILNKPNDKYLCFYCYNIYIHLMTEKICCLGWDSYACTHTRMHRNTHAHCWINGWMYMYMHTLVIVCSELPASRSRSTASLWPSQRAKNNGVWPSLSWTQGLAPHFSKRDMQLDVVTMGTEWHSYRTARFQVSLTVWSLIPTKVYLMEYSVSWLVRCPDYSKVSWLVRCPNYS